MDSEIKNKQQEKDMEIDLVDLFRQLWQSRLFIVKAAGIGAVIGLIVAFSIPKEYTVNVTLSPESGKSSGMGGLSGMASMLGVTGMSMNAESDALNITLFPEILASTPFILELFDVQVRTVKDSSAIPLTAYLEEQRSPWWNTLMGVPGMAIGGVKSLFAEKIEVKDVALNPFQLTPKQSGQVNAIRSSIEAKTDKKSGTTIISVTLQDPLAAALLADTVVLKLQNYVTAYRTSKAQEDCSYLEQLYKERQQEYYTAQQQYARYMDANKNVVLQSVLTERERLQNEMSLAYQVYTQVATQLQVARAKVQEAKPVFAVVEPATVPVRPSGKGKLIFLLAFAFLAAMGTLFWVLVRKPFNEIITNIKNKNN